MPKFITHCERETINLGRHLARRRLTPGSVVALYGELGTGKTRFVKGICEELGVSEHVASPTFKIVNEYLGEFGRLFHFDFYRVNSVAEIEALGFDEYLTNGGICIIEWAEKATTMLPERRFDVRFSLRPSPDEREIEIIEVGKTTE